MGAVSKSGLKAVALMLGVVLAVGIVLWAPWLRTNYLSGLGGLGQQTGLLCEEDTRFVQGPIEGYEPNARSGRDAIKGLVLEYLPAGLPAGIVSLSDFGDQAGKSWGYGYTWIESIAADGGPSLFVFVNCGDVAQSLDSVVLRADGRFFTTPEPYQPVRGKEAVRSVAHGGGLTVAWIEEPGVVVQISASEGLVDEIDRIVAGARVGGRG